jgi:hypothetical protein
MRGCDTNGSCEPHQIEECLYDRVDPVSVLALNMIEVLWLNFVAVIAFSTFLSSK